jgi:hypothetical protein
VGRRVNLKEAAEVFGSTSEAIRKRAKRGTIPSEIGDDGMLYVWVDGRVDGTRDEDSHQVDGEVDDGNQVGDGGERVDDHLPALYRDLLLDRMGSEIDHLREQLREEREANRENRRIIAGLVQRVPELESAPEPPESSQTPSEQQVNGHTPPESQGQERRSWWRRLFEG